MSSAAYHPVPIRDVDEVVPTDGPKGRRLHRIREVRRQQGVSLRRVARALKVDYDTVRDQEEETTDLPLSLVYQWQKVLDVPVSDLLIDTEASLSAPVMQRARLVKLMKTAQAIMEKAEAPPIRRMAETLITQLCEIMPELKDVSPWHAVGQRRTLNEYGRVVERRLTDGVWRDL